MLVSRKLTCLVAGVGALMAVASMPLKQAQAAEFTGGSFSCLEFTNGLGETASGRVQSVLARQWILGYLAGYYKTQGKIEYSEVPGDMDKLDALMVAKCKEFPQATIFAMAAQMLANEPRKLPKNVTADFSPTAYTCGQHVDAKSGAAGDANRADLAENWAFAFIQGAKNVATPNMEIRAENKPQLIGVMNKACGNARDTLYADLAALVAEKVKLQ